MEACLLALHKLSIDCKVGHVPPVSAVPPYPQPPVPVSESACTVDIMDSLSAEFFSIGGSHFLIYVDKNSSFIWCRRFKQMTTSNAIKLLKEITHDHGRSKVVTTDSGPAL